MQPLSYPPEFVSGLYIYDVLWDISNVIVVSEDRCWVRHSFCRRRQNTVDHHLIVVDCVTFCEGVDELETKMVSTIHMVISQP